MRALALAISLLVAGLARAEPAPLRADVPVDASVTGAAAALWLSSELLFKHQLAPAHCRWCVPNGFDSAVRDGLVWQNPHTADVLSNVDAFALMPLLAFGGTALAAHHDGANGNIGVDLLVIGEAAMLAQDVNQAVKFAAGRERPFVHQLPASQKGLTAAPDDNNLSFFSGHTTWAFSLATAAGMVCSLHHYKLAPWVWALGMTFATSTAYLRIAADKHYATDVLTGALVGALFGVGIPLLHRPQAASPRSQGLGLAFGPAGGGLSVGMSGVF